MKGAFVILAREYRTHFISPVAYIFSIAFLLITGGGFMIGFFIRGTADMDFFFNMLPWVAMLFVPALSMRIWAEERKQGTLALLQSLPVRTGEVVIGKFLASWLFYLTVLAGTLPLAAVVAWFGDPDMGRIASGYMGAALLGGLFLAAGMWAGSPLSDQIAAFILGVLVSFGLHALGTEELGRFLDGWAGGLGAFLGEGAGAASHYGSFMRGFISFSDIMYFLCWSCAFLALTVHALTYPLRYVKDSYATLFAVLLLGSSVFLCAFFEEAGLARFDLTSQETYSLSEESNRLLSGLRHPVEITYYVSPQTAMPSGLKNFEKEVKERLSAYSWASGNVGFRVVRMADPDSEEARELARRGVIPFAVRTVSRDDMDVTKIYSAVTMTSLADVEQAVPQLLPENLNGLEYQLMSTLARLERKGAPYVSMYARIEMPDERYTSTSVQKTFTRLGSRIPAPVDRYDQLAELLKKEEGYVFERISLEKNPPVPEKTDCLLVIGPEGFGEKQEAAIGEFLAGGKDVILALDGNRYEYRPGGSGGVYVKASGVNTGLSGFLEKIGVPLSDRVLMDENQDTAFMTRRADVGGKAGETVRVPVRLPIQPLVSGAQIAGGEPVLSGVSRLSAVWGTAIRPDPEKLAANGLTWRVLFTSSPLSWETEPKTGDLPPDYFTPPEKRTPGLPLAVLVEGDFSRIFPAGGDATGGNEGRKGRLLLVGSAEMFSNAFLPQADNRLMLMNVVDAFTFGGDLIPLRTRIHAMARLREATDAEKLWARVVGVGMVPAVMITAGTWIFVSRNRRRKAYEKAWKAALHGRAAA